MSEDQRPLAIAIMGPTASGKTALALEWAQRLNTKIISVDSALVYRGLDIGSAKPAPGSAEYAQHRLIDIRDPHETYSAADFAVDAVREMRELAAQNKIPILAGGTGLYFRALLDGLSEMPEADDQTRAQIEAEAGRRGWAAMHDELSQVDPAAAKRIHPNDPQRIQRALEVFRLTGKPISEWQAQSVRKPFTFRVLKVIVCPQPRALLHERIAQRFDQMLAQNFLKEVQALMSDSRLQADLPSMRAVGYRQAWEHLSGHHDVNTFRDQAIFATRQLAKRQLTWLRAMQDVRWFDPTNANDLQHLHTAIELFTRR
jgi:tRNA dimethylallyltransferase